MYNAPSTAVPPEGTPMIAVGQHNAITDVDGIRVGNVHDGRIRSGVTVLLPDQPCVAAADIRGGAPGTRETDLLDPANSVETIHGLVFSGGTAFGLDAASGAISWLAGQGRGVEGSRHHGPNRPGRDHFRSAGGWCAGLAPEIHPIAPWRSRHVVRLRQRIEQGNVGAGMGATAGTLKGGLGTASRCREDGIQVGALAIANPFGSTGARLIRVLGRTVRNGRRTGWAIGAPGMAPEDMPYHIPGMEGANTTLVAVATNLALTRGQAKRMAIMAQDGSRGQSVRFIHRLMATASLRSPRGRSAISRSRRRFLPRSGC